jgi:ABC-type transporter Mla subunit MlaD
MTRLKNAAENAAEAIGRVAERIEKIEAPADLLSAKLAPAIDKIDRAAAAVGRRAEAEAGQIARLEEVLAQTIKGAELADQRLQAVARTVSELEGLGATVAALRRALEGGMGAIPETLEKHQRLLEDLKSAAARRTEEATASFNKAIRRQDEVLADFAKSLDKRSMEALGNLGRDSMMRAKELADFSQSLAGTLDAIRDHNRQLEAELERSRRLTLEVQNALASMAELVIRRLGPVDAARE